MNELPPASRSAYPRSFGTSALITAWKMRCSSPKAGICSFSTLRTIQPGKARVSGGEPWMAVAPPAAARTSAKRSAAAAATMPIAWAGLETSRP